VSEALGGWEADTVAAEAADYGCRVDYVTCECLLALTGGLPLFGQSALRSAATQYDGDVAAFCSDLDGMEKHADDFHLMLVRRDLEAIDCGFRKGARRRSTTR
jgi:hypothetical protein